MGYSPWGCRVGHNRVIEWGSSVQTNLLRLFITPLARSIMFLATPPKSSDPQHRGPQVTLRRHPDTDG